MKHETKKIVEIDAADKSLGRLASEIAFILRGKHKSSFAPNKEDSDIVSVVNIDKMKITGKKMDKKIYYRHSGYPGGIKAEILKDVYQKNPKEVLKRAVHGMLSKNKLQVKMIKRLKIM